MSCCRFLLNKPNYGLLDECTAACSRDFEDAFFEKCLELNITLVTIAHNPDLIRYHKQNLYIIGKGEWKIRPVS